MPQGRSILFVADDYLESVALNKLAGLLQSQINPGTILRFGKPTDTTSTYENAVYSHTAICIAISNRNETELTAAAGAIKLKKPLALLSLGYNAWRKPAFEFVRYNAKLLLVSDQSEVEPASRLFPHAKVVATGNPEWDGIERAQYSRSEVRSRLSVSSGKKLILVSGEKSLKVNFALAAIVIEAIARTDAMRQCRVVFAVHPGHDKVPAGNDLCGFYKKELADYDSGVQLDVSCKADPFGIGAPDMVAGADLVIGTTSTIQMQAVFQRKPSISIFLRPLLSHDVEVPTKECWLPVERGAIAGLYDYSAETLSKLINALLTHEGFAPLKSAQEKYYQPQKPGASHQIMIEHLVELTQLQSA